MILPSPPINAAQQIVPITVPAPLGGLNGRDPLAAMPKTDAYLMDNFFPGTSSIESRKGCEKYIDSALDGPVQSLEVYSGADGQIMLAWAGGKIYDVSLSAPDMLKSGLFSSVVITTMFSNAADNSQHLICASGLDTPYRFDGAAFSDLVLTGVTGSDTTLNFVFTFKGRLYFLQEGRLGFYYLPVGQIQGALSYFDLGQVSKKGGTVVAIASVSESGNGNTPDDYIVFITSEGECIVYAGLDPSSANAWSLIGRFYTAAPIGRRCTVNFGGELLLLTLEGALPFSEIRRAGDAEAQGVAGPGYSALTSKLGHFLSDFNAYADVPGWEGLQYAGGGGWLIINVPASASIAGRYYHFVMNTTTKSWCRFTGWNGLTFCVFNRRLYFGRYDGYVMLADEGRLDDGEAIQCDCKQAYIYFDDGSGMALLRKHFQWAALLVGCDGSPPLSGQFSVDFKERQPGYSAELPAPFGSPWDAVAWDVGVWGEDTRTQRFIVTLNTEGVAGSIWLRASLQGLTLLWYATQFTMEKTRGVL
jgi:hypothetical protein